MKGMGKPKKMASMPPMGGNKNKMPSPPMTSLGGQDGQMGNAPAFKKGGAVKKSKKK